MYKYYKLSVLREDKQGADWESFYLEINGEKPKIILYVPGRIMGGVSNSKLEKITEKEIKEAISESNIDHGH